MTARERAQAFVDGLEGEGIVHGTALVARIEATIEAALREQEVLLHEKWLHRGGDRDYETEHRV